jgi:hypothetical protein
VGVELAVGSPFIGNPRMMLSRPIIVGSVAGRLFWVFDFEAEDTGLVVFDAATDLPEPPGAAESVSVAAAPPRVRIVEEDVVTVVSAPDCGVG